ncbi:hypothetical protein [Streptomyces sp. NBC_00019]|uniref:hypothetical protein n=1 Tax=Streptomyces sp. NBC_00019 TaxID=2975623 RepID=UPI0032466E39
MPDATRVSPANSSRAELPRWMTTPPSAKPSTIPSGNASTSIPSTVALAPPCAARPGSAETIRLHPTASSAPRPSSRT